MPFLPFRQTNGPGKSYTSIGNLHTNNISSQHLMAAEKNMFPLAFLTNGWTDILNHRVASLQKM